MISHVDDCDVAFLLLKGKEKTALNVSQQSKSKQQSKQEQNTQNTPLFFWRNLRHLDTLEISITFDRFVEISRNNIYEECS